MSEKQDSHLDAINMPAYVIYIMKRKAAKTWVHFLKFSGQICTRLDVLEEPYNNTT